MTPTITYVTMTESRTLHQPFIPKFHLYHNRRLQSFQVYSTDNYQYDPERRIIGYLLNNQWFIHETTIQLFGLCHSQIEGFLIQHHRLLAFT